MLYFLDTNICIYYLKGVHPPIAEHLKKVSPDKVKIPAMVQSELLLGAAKSRQKKDNKARIEAFLGPLEIIPFDAEAADFHAEIRNHLEAAGKPIGPHDLILAATTLARHGTLVTNNEKEFRRVPGLKTANWTK